MRQQQGASFFGIIFLLAILAGIVSIAIKIVPSYIDFLTVSNVTGGVINQPRMSLQRNDEVIKKISQQLSINNIRLNELGEDVISLSREDGVLTADIDYVVKKPLFTSDDLEMTINMHFTKSHEASDSN